MRIGMIIPSLLVESGGPPRVCSEMSTALSAQGIEVVIATGHFGSGDASPFNHNREVLDKAGVEIRSFRKQGRGNCACNPGLMRYLRANVGTFSLLHIHGVWLPELTWAAACGRHHGTPYLVHPHGSLDRWSRAQSRVKKRVSLTCLGTRRMLEHAAAIVYGTIDESREAEDLQLSAPTEIIPNGIFIRDDLPSVSQARARLHELFPVYREGDLILLWFSRFHRKKGLHLLIEAFADIAPHYPRVRLLAAGLPQDDGYLDEQRERVESLGLEERITITTQYTGEKGRMLLRAADIFVQPSYEEGFSIAILEAMAQALPILITDRCHLPETESRRAGVVVSPSREGLATGLQALLDRSKEELTGMGEQAREWVRSDFSWDSIGKRLIAAYRTYIT